MASSVGVNFDIPITKKARDRIRQEREQKEAEEKVRSALLNSIKIRHRELFDEFGFTKNTSLKDIQAALGTGETLNKLNSLKALDQFRQERAAAPTGGVRPPGGVQPPIDPSTLVQAADQLGVPPELQQSRPLINPRGRGIIPESIPTKFASEGISDIQKENIDITGERIKKDDERLRKIKENQQNKTKQTTKTLAGLHTGNKAYASAVTEGVEFLASHGVNVDPSRGIEGKIFSYANPLIAKLGYNKFFNSYEEGIRAELPPELAKTLGGQGTGVRIGMAIINTMKQTLGRLSGNTVAEVAEQQIQTATQTWRKYLVEQTDTQGNFKYSPENVGELEAVLQEIKDYETVLVYKSYMRSGAYIPKYKTLKTKDGTKYKDVPDFLWEIVERKTGAK